MSEPNHYTKRRTYRLGVDTEERITWAAQHLGGISAADVIRAAVAEFVGRLKAGEGNGAGRIAPKKIPKKSRVAS